jgi:deoxyribonuclease V
MAESIQKALKLQQELARKVLQQDAFGPIHLIGGMDVSCNLYDPAQMVYAAAVVLSYPDLHVVAQATTSQKQTFPYVPGFLSFREAPALIAAFEKLPLKPDLIFVDGHGIAHPRKLGIASHIGVLLDIPTIGVAKSILVGAPEAPLAPNPGSQTPLHWKGECLAMLLRSKLRSLPLIISPGHRISLPTAVEYVQKSLRGYRLPEPTRQAHLAANRCRTTKI